MTVSNEQARVYANVNRAYGNFEINDATARVIASWFHGGQSSALYSLASTGAIDKSRIVTEISEALSESQETSDRRALSMLATYAMNRPDKGPVAGWSALWV